jgi:hypothetical protein
MQRSLFFLLSFGLAACALPELPAERGDEAAPDGEDATAEAALPVHGTANKVLTLDGSGDRLSADSYTAIEPSGSLTIEAWIHPTSVTGTRTIVNNPGRYRLLLDGGKPQLCVTTTDAGTTTEKCNTFTTLTVPANEWTFLAAVFNKNAGSVTARLYKEDGTEPAATITGVNGIPADADAVDNKVRFGWGFAGFIDEVRIWTDTRTVNQTKNGRKQNLDCGLSKLGGYWRLDNSADESCGQATGTLHGDAAINSTAALLNKNCTTRGKSCVCDVHADCDGNAGLACNGTTCQLTKSCKELNAAQPSLASKDYPIQMGSYGEQTVYCDMTPKDSDPETNDPGPGWTLVLAYNHTAMTSLPLSNDENIPTSLSADSHMSADKMSALNEDNNASTLPFTEMRFYCDTTHHDRKIHFITANTDAIKYFLDIPNTIYNGNPVSRNSATYWSSLPSSSLLAGHNANLPQSTTFLDDDAPANRRMTGAPFWLSNTSQGIVRWYLPTGSTYYHLKWECDDFAYNEWTTHHRVWVR